MLVITEFDYSCSSSLNQICLEKNRFDRKIFLDEIESIRRQKASFQQQQQGRQAKRKRKCSTVQMTDHHLRRGNVANDKKEKTTAKKWSAVYIFGSQFFQIL